MNRRAFLRVAASVGAVGAIAGCTEDASNNDSDGGSPGGGETGTGNSPSGTDTATATPTGSPPTTGDTTTSPSNEGVARTGTKDGVDYTIEVTGSGCATGERINTVDDIEFEEVAKQVVVTGTIDAANPCKVVDVSEITHDTDAGSVTVTIETAAPEAQSKMCVQCIGAVDYEATFEFSGSFPNEATVVHDGQSGRREVAGAAYGSSGASAPTTSDRSSP